jgi:hypothetical protein
MAAIAFTPFLLKGLKKQKLTEVRGWIEVSISCDVGS